MPIAKPAEEDLVCSTERVWLDSGKTRAINQYSNGGDTWNIHKEIADYTFDLEVPIENVHTVRLKQFYVPVSARFYVVRSSRLFTVGDTDFDTIHDAALTISVDEGSIVAGNEVIYNTEGTISLNVQAVMTATLLNDAQTQFRTYDVFMCTGTLNSVDTSALFYSAPDFQTAAMSMSGAPSDDGTSTVAAANQGESSVAVFTEHQTYNLHVALNGCPLRRIVEPKYPANGRMAPWAAYKMYYPNQILNNSEDDTVGQRYLRVLKPHFSLDLSQDITAGKIAYYTLPASGYLPIAKSGSNGAFVVLQPTENSEYVMAGLENNKYETETKVSLVDSIHVWWTDQHGRPVIFPATQRFYIESITTAASNTVTIERKTNTLLLEFDTFKVKPGCHSWA